MFHLTDDLRIAQLKPLIPPAILMEQFPLTEAAAAHRYMQERQNVGKVVLTVAA